MRNMGPQYGRCDECKAWDVYVDNRFSGKCERHPPSIKRTTTDYIHPTTQCYQGCWDFMPKEEE